MTNVELIKACVDTVKNPERLAFAAGSKHEAEKAIHTQVMDILGLESKPTHTQFQRAMRANGHEVFEILEEVLSQTFLESVDNNEFFRQFADVRNVALGDSIQFVLQDDGIVTVSEVSNGNWDIRRQKLEGGQAMQVKTKTYGAKMYGDFFDFVMERINFGMFITKVAQGFERHLNLIIANAFADAQNKLPAPFKVTGAYDEDKLLSLYDKVNAVSGSATIVGTRSALNKIVTEGNVDWIIPEQKQSMQQTGSVGYYKGMRLVQLPQVFKEGTFDFAYDDNKLMVIPASEQVKPVKVIIEGDALVREFTQNTDHQDQTLEYTFTTTYGAEVAFEGLFGTYDIQ